MAPAFGEEFRRDLLTLFTWRRDVRRFQTAAIAPGIVDGLLESACLAPSVGLSEPWRFVTVDDPRCRAAIRTNFVACNDRALAGQLDDRAAHYAALKLAGLDEAPCHVAVFAVADPAQGHGLGRMTMPETTAYSAVMAIHTLWLTARAQGLGLGWVSILDPAAVTAALDMPAEWVFIGYLCLGWPESEDDAPELERARWERRIGANAVRLRR